MDSIERAKHRSPELVRAIERYTHAHGPPQSLDDLVPKYISSVPHTNSRKYSDFVYTTDRSDEGWSLEIHDLEGIFSGGLSSSDPLTYRYDPTDGIWIDDSTWRSSR
jgi:hypothetical protein